MQTHTSSDACDNQVSGPQHSSSVDVETGKEDGADDSYQLANDHEQYLSKPIIGSYYKYSLVGHRLGQLT